MNPIDAGFAHLFIPDRDGITCKNTVNGERCGRIEEVLVHSPLSSREIYLYERLAAAYEKIEELDRRTNGSIFLGPRF